MKRLITFSMILLFAFSCKKEDDEPVDTGEGDVVITFSTDNHFSGLIAEEEVRIVENDFNFFRSNNWYGNAGHDISIVQFGGYFKFENLTDDIIIISFAKSYKDKLLIINSEDSSSQLNHSNKNPFVNSNEFHNIFSINGNQPFFYSKTHGSDQMPKEEYTGLVVDLKYNSRWYNTYIDFSTDPLNNYEILKYEAIRESAEPQPDGTYALPYGKVKVRFNCYVKEKNGGPGIIHIKNAEFQGVINKN